MLSRVKLSELRLLVFISRVHLAVQAGLERPLITRRNRFNVHSSIPPCAALLFGVDELSGGVPVGAQEWCGRVFAPHCRGGRAHDRRDQTDRLLPTILAGALPSKREGPPQFAVALTDDSGPAIYNRTLQVRMRPAPVVIRLSSTLPSVPGNHFQNFGDDTGTMPFVLHHPTYAA